MVVSKRTALCGLAVAGLLLVAVAALLLCGRAAAAASGDEVRVWTSAALCRQVVEVEHGRMADDAAAGSLRLGTWNIEWFPDHTHVGWLACAIAWMNLDLLGVVEIRDTEAARARMAELLAELGRLTGEPWQVDLQRCGAAASQHVGFLWDARRLRLAQGEDDWSLNDRARGPEEPCAGWLRPGRHGYFIPRDDAQAGFHAIVVHLKSGARPEDAAERAAALANLARATARLGANGERVVLLGDFNTMGDGRRGSAAVEVQALAERAAAAAPALRQAPLLPACTEYYRGRGGRLDHLLASAAMGTLEEGRTRVSGYCALAGCAPISPWQAAERPAAYRSLSDHCPVVVEIAHAFLSRTRN